MLLTPRTTWRLGDGDGDGGDLDGVAAVLLVVGDDEPRRDASDALRFASRRGNLSKITREESKLFRTSFTLLTIAAR